MAYLQHIVQPEAGQEYLRLALRRMRWRKRGEDLYHTVQWTEYLVDFEEPTNERKTVTYDPDRRVFSLTIERERDPDHSTHIEVDTVDKLLPDIDRAIVIDVRIGPGFTMPWCQAIVYKHDQRQQQQQYNAVAPNDDDHDEHMSSSGTSSSSGSGSSSTSSGSGSTSSSASMSESGEA